MDQTYQIMMAVIAWVLQLILSGWFGQGRW
jgi:DNA-binding transcriptional regulator of glucitol operon